MCEALNQRPDNLHGQLFAPKLDHLLDIHKSLNYQIFAEKIYLDVVFVARKVFTFMRNQMDGCLRQTIIVFEQNGEQLPHAQSCLCVRLELRHVHLAQAGSIDCLIVRL